MSRYKTPLRYPGGKQKLAPFIAEIIAANDMCGCDYVEPYAGGAGVAIELLLSGVARRIHLNDSSYAIYAFWRSILKDSESFCRKISRASLTIEEWKKQREILSHQRDYDLNEVGFSLFYLNRCNRSGIPSGGVIGGLKQDGPWKIDARFPRTELIKRIEAIASYRKSITVKKMDAEDFLQRYIPHLPKKTFVYCDPPYFNKADRLYLNHYNAEDHKRISSVIQTKVKRPWLVSYDCEPEVVRHYNQRRSFVYSLQYNAASAYKGKEVFFFSDRLKLLRTSSVVSIKQALEQCSDNFFSPAVA